MKKNKKELKTINLPKSVNKNIRSSSRKIDLILKSVVGKKVQDALRDLTFANRRISKEIQKTLLFYALLPSRIRSRRVCLGSRQEL